MDRRFPFFTSNSGHLSRRSSASTAPVVGTTSIPLLYLFLGFQLVDQILLPILIVTFLFSKTVKRHPVVVNVCITWIITGVFSSLLLYAGKHVGPEPPMLLCAAQASLLDGVIPMDAIAVLTLMFQVNLNIRKPKAQPNGVFTYALLVAPYIALFCFSTAAAALSAQNPRNVSRERRFFYCSLSSSPISNTFALFSALALIAALGLAVSLGIFLRNNWRALRQAGNIDLPFLSRVAGFVLYVSLSLVLSILSIIAPRSPFPDLFTASTGTALSLFLCTQRDVMRAWFPCLFEPASPPPATNNKGITVMKDPNPNDPDFDFKDSETPVGHDLDIESSMGTSVIQFEDLDLSDAEVSVSGINDLDVEERGNFKGRLEEQDLSDTEMTEDFIDFAKGEASVMHNTPSPNPKDRYIPRHWRSSPDGNTSEASTGDRGLYYEAMNVAPSGSYRFARPGMI